MSYQKNQMVTIEIEDIGADGEGIGKIDGFPLFVKDAVPGDLVEVKIVKRKRITLLPDWKKYWNRLRTAPIRPVLFTDSAEAVRYRLYLMQNSSPLNSRK